MPARKSSTKIKSHNDDIQVLEEVTWPTTSGKSTLGYQIGLDPDGVIQFQVTSNDDGGFFSVEWVALSDMQEAIKAWPEHQPITSMGIDKLTAPGERNLSAVIQAMATSHCLNAPSLGFL